MPWECSIRLLNEDGRPLSDYKITIFFSGLLGSMEHARTDSDGWATFENPYVDYDERSVDSAHATLSMFPSVITKTLMDGGSISNGETMSFTVSDDDWR
jgi:hypothetical protein